MFQSIDFRLCLLDERVELRDLLCVLPLLESRAQASTHLLPFQGRLSDANGQPIADVLFARHRADLVQRGGRSVRRRNIGGVATWQGRQQRKQ